MVIKLTELKAQIYFLLDDSGFTRTLIVSRNILRIIIFILSHNIMAHIIILTSIRSW